MTKLLIIGTGGFIGAILRYSISIWMNSSHKLHSTAGTFIVNITGCLVLGVLTGMAEEMNIPEHLRLFLSVGFLGALTTFSTFSLETLQLIRKGEVGESLIYVASSVIIGLFAAFTGYKGINLFK